LKRNTAKKSSRTTFARNADGSGGSIWCPLILEGVCCHKTQYLLLELSVYFVHDGNDIWQ
jgi:hypothetical protein